MVLGYIDWNVDPIFLHFQLGPIDGLRYYSILFALAFIFGYQLIAKMFKTEGCPEDWADKIFMYTIIGTVIGARLGHVFFYGWEYYSKHLLDILKIYEGGLASHGGAIGILTALYIYHKRVSKKSFLWVVDHIVIVVALSGFFIRLGNLMNSEIVGQPTDLPWGFRFLWNKDESMVVPRHPSQIYESIYYLLVFVLLSYLYWKKDYIKKEGAIFGLFLVLVFGFRMIIENLKADQEAFEADMLLNMGQLLSIPFVLAGIWCIYNSLIKK